MVFPFRALFWLLRSLFPPTLFIGLRAFLGHFVAGAARGGASEGRESRGPEEGRRPGFKAVWPNYMLNSIRVETCRRIEQSCGGLSDATVGGEGCFPVSVEYGVG